MAVADVNVEPFTADQTAFGKDGTVTGRKITARRRDGSTATLHWFGAMNLPPVRRIDLPDGRYGVFVDSLTARSTGAKPTKETASWRDSLAHPPQSCAPQGARAEGTETILGETVWKVVRENPGIRTTEWAAARLECFPLKILIESKDSGGSWNTVASLETRALRFGEPAALLFDEAFQYREMSPSELRRMLFEELRLNEDACPECNIPKNDTELDKRYFKQRK